MACSFTPHDQPVRWNPLRRTYSCRTSTARSAFCKSCNSWPSTLLIIPVDIRITTAQTWKLPQTRRSRSKRGGRQNVEAHPLLVFSEHHAEIEDAVHLGIDAGDQRAQAAELVHPGPDSPSVRTEAV